MDIFIDSSVLYTPSKTVNAKGVAVSGLEIAQNSMGLDWPLEKVSCRLKKFSVKGCRKRN